MLVLERLSRKADGGIWFVVALGVRPKLLVLGAWAVLKLIVKVNKGTLNFGEQLQLELQGLANIVRLFQRLNERKRGVRPKDKNKKLTANHISRENNVHFDQEARSKIECLIRSITSISLSPLHSGRVRTRTVSINRTRSSCV